MALITTPFGFQTPAAEVAAGVDLSDKRIVVTGAASGIETALTLARTRAQVTLAVRDTSAGERVAAEILALTGSKDVRVAHLDLNDHASIAAFAHNWKGPLHVLVNNAGGMAMPEQYTPEGWEMQFATNHLGHFALALALHPVLAAAKGAHRRREFQRTHALAGYFRRYSFRVSSLRSPAGLWTVKNGEHPLCGRGDRALEGGGNHRQCLTPGAIATNLQRYVGGKPLTPSHLQKTPQQGAATSVLLATSPLLEGIGGRYFVNCNEAEVVSKFPSDMSGTGVAPYALDSDNAKRLWEVSLQMLDRA